MSTSTVRVFALASSLHTLLTTFSYAQEEADGSTAPVQDASVQEP